MKRSSALLCLLVLLAGCIPPSQPPQQQNGPAELQAFASDADLKQYILTQYPSLGPAGPLDTLLGNLLGLPATSIMPFYYPGTTVSYDPVTATVGGFAGTDPQALRAGEIDKARLIGEQLFVLSDFGLTILSAIPADQMTVLGRFLTASVPTGLYPLDGGRLVVLTSGFTPYDYPHSYSGSDLAWLPNMDPYFDVYILDVNDPAAPTVLARYSIQGSPITTRVVGVATLAILSVSYPGGEPFNSMRDIAHAGVADLLPTCRLTDAAGNQAVKPLLSWDKVLRPANPDGGAILTVSTIDLATPGAVPAATGIVGYWDTAYATPTSLYLTNTAWLVDGTYRHDTELHRFDLTGQTAQYAGSVKLPGRPFTSSAFSEKDALLRVVTSDVSPYYTETDVSVTTSLFILAASDTGLDITGRLDNIEAGTQMFGVEYIGNYAGLGGFDGQDNVSILVDLADPQHPTSLGRIPVSPYASYVHLLDETHALAIGSIPDNPDDFSNFGGDFTLMMYDVPSVAGTTMAHSHTVGSGGTNSTIYSSREELFLSDGLLILPISLYEGTIPDDFGQQTFGGLYLYRMTQESGFTPLGRIETADPYVGTAWTRAILKDNILYAVTNATVQAAPLDAPGQILSKVRLP